MSIKGEKKEEVPAKLLDELFKKTKVLPSVYWLPLTDEQVFLFFNFMIQPIDVVLIAKHYLKGI